MPANSPRILTRKDLDEDEHRVDQVRGRRYCRTHRDQQMIPLLPGLDMCPACHPAARGEFPQFESESDLD